MNGIATPIAMLLGRGNGPALIVAGLLIVAWLAHQSAQPKPPTAPKS